MPGFFGAGTGDLWPYGREMVPAIGFEPILEAL